MLRSMYSAVSGLRAHGAQMDVVGNNLANVNTTGFKSSIVNFADVLSQTVKGPLGSTADHGSAPGAQIGLGVSVSSIQKVFTQGPVLETGRQADMAIQGEGMFILSSDQNNVNRTYTRDGSFSISNDGSLVNSTGSRLLGWNADAVGAVNTSNPIAALKVSIGQRFTLKSTANLSLKGNLDGSAPAGTVVNGAIYEFDSKGTQHTIPVTYTRTATANQWTVSVGVITDPNIASVTPVSSAGAPTIAFLPDGSLDTTNTTFRGFDVTYVASAGLTNQVGTGPGLAGITADVTALQQVAGTSEINQTLQDGFGPGTLVSFSLSEAGEIQGIFSNGHNVRLGIVALAGFLAPDGLVAIGGNSYVASPASGDPSIGEPGKTGHGTLRGGAIEGSNVDLAQEFTRMISAQRGFQANAKVITTSDQMMEELASLKR